MADKPTLALNNAAALRLAQLIGTAQLLTNPDLLYLIGAFNEDHLSDLVPQPATPERGKDAPAAEWQAWERELIAWGRVPVPPIETTIKRRDALKALVKSAAEKGILSGALGDRTLLRVLELATPE